MTSTDKRASTYDAGTVGLLVLHKGSSAAGWFGGRRSDISSMIPPALPLRSSVLVYIPAGSLYDYVGRCGSWVADVVLSKRALEATVTVATDKSMPPSVKRATAASVAVAPTSDAAATVGAVPAVGMTAAAVAAAAVAVVPALGTTAVMLPPSCCGS